MSPDPTPVVQPLDQLQLRHEGLGRLSLIGTGGQAATPVVAVRAFPLQAPDEGIALVGDSGAELVWIDHLNVLNPGARQAVTAALAARDFMPKITRMLGVSTFATPSVWTVETDRGPAELVLKGEEDLRILPGPGPRVLITSSHGLVYVIPDLSGLDRKSKKMLERFL